MPAQRLNNTESYFTIKDKWNINADIIDQAQAIISPSDITKYYRGDKTWQTLNKAAVGLANIDNTSDANKPVSNLQQQAIDLKLDKGYSLTELRNLSNSKVNTIGLFYCLELDKEGFWRKYTGSTSGLVDNTGTLIQTTGGLWLERIITDGLIKPEWFGAVGNGLNDDTAGIQNAVNYIFSSTPNGNDRVLIFSSNKIYITGKITFPSDGTITLKGQGLYSSYIKLKDNADESMFVVGAGDCIPYFENLFLNGNKSNQTSTNSHGIEYLDAVDTSYKRAGMFYNCNIINFKGDGIHGGQYKQLLRITNCDVRHNDGHGVYQPLNNADWFVNSGDFGNNGKSNFYISSQIQIINASIYYAGESNIYFGDHCRWSSVVNSLIDHAGKHGIEINTSNTNPCGVDISGNRFYLNSQSATNTYSHISLTNTNGVIVTNNHFIRIPGQDVGLGDAKYLIEFNNTTKTNFFGNTWDSGSYLTNVTNNDSVIGNLLNDSYFGSLVVNGNIRNRKNISFTDNISPNIGSQTGHILGINKLVFGNGDPTQVLAGGRIGSNGSNTQLQIDYGSAGIVFRNNSLVATWFSDVVNRTFFNTTNTYDCAQVGIDSTNRGFLPPRINGTGSVTGTKVKGLIIFDTTDNKIKVYNGSSWETITSS